MGHALSLNGIVKDLKDKIIYKFYVEIFSFKVFFLSFKVSNTQFLK